MDGQSRLSDFFKSPPGPRPTRRPTEAITLSSDGDSDDAVPVASTSKVVIPAKRAAPSGPVSVVKKAKASTRVDRFRFSPSKPAQDDRSSSLPPAAATSWSLAPPENAALHDAFVAKLKGPRKSTKVVEVIEEDVKPSLADKFAHKSAKAKGKQKEAAVKYTPLEEQVIKLKAEHPGVLLLFQVGYKFRFFGQDAVNAARVLNIACFMDRTFESAMVPEHRIDVHVRRLLTAGYKVGIVRQMETAALKKVGDNKSGPFVRKLTNLYTQATRVEELDHTNAPTSSTTVLAIIEEPIGGAGADERVRIGLVAVQPSTADVVYDAFEDGFMRSELETRLLHLEPGELVMSEEVSKQTERMVNYLLKQEFDGITGRLEQLPSRQVYKYERALSNVNDFYASSHVIAGDDEIDVDEPANNDLEERLACVAGMTQLSVIALSTLIDYLKQYELEAVFRRGPMHHFDDRLSMKLNANTLQNLEIFVNQTDFAERGSLFWILDHTKTRMGRRLLRKWLARPLTDLAAVNARLDAVDEILTSKSYLVGKFRGLLMGLPDLERGLCRIHYKKASAQELCRVLQAFVRVGEAFGPNEGKDAFRSPALVGTLASLQPAREAAEGRLTLLNAAAASAKDGKLADVLVDPEVFPALQDCRDCLDAVLWELDEELKKAAVILKKPALEYITVAQEEFLIEVRKTDAAKLVPAEWSRINGTKTTYRYRSPRMMTLLDERDQCQERLDAEAKRSFLDFLTRVSEDSAAYRETISRLSTLDCLFSLADVGNQPGYCRPTFVEESGIHVKGLRHPMIEQLRPDPYVPNDIAFEPRGLRTMCLSGANMGGKSSFARAIGCYVAAETFTAGLCDGVFTRMGASDELARGRSTFMVELSETSTILKTATSRSLIVFDELGRGTSTYDGLAIAHAVLDHVVHAIDPLCIFISHFPALGKGLADSCRLYHMAYEEQPRITGIPDVVFLHKLAPGPAGSSHGLNVARMAGLPASLLARAREEADQLRESVEARTAAARAARVLRVLLRGDEDVDEREGAVEAAGQLVELVSEV